MIDYYEVLRIDEEASECEITQAYRNLAKQYHPDKSPERRDFNMLKVKTNLSQIEGNQLIQLEKKFKRMRKSSKKYERHIQYYRIQKKGKCMTKKRMVINVQEHLNLQVSKRCGVSGMR